MRDPQFAATMRRRQGDDQRAEHPVGLLRVPMREKETVPVVQKQLVKRVRSAFVGSHSKVTVADR